MGLSDLVKNALVCMFNSGMGPENKKKRYNAERAIMELKEGVLKREWDMRVICKVKNAKQLFTTMYAAQKASGAAVMAAAGQVLAQAGDGEVAAAEGVLIEDEVQNDEDALEDIAVSGNVNETEDISELLTEVDDTEVVVSGLEDAEAADDDEDEDEENRKHAMAAQMTKAMNHGMDSSSAD